MVQDKPVPEVADEIHRCNRCGLVLGELTRVCPRCLRRGATLRRLLGYPRPYGWRLAVTAVLMLLSTGLMMVPSALMKPLLDKVLIPHNPALLPWLVLGVVLAALLSNGFMVLRGRLTAWLGARVSFDIRAQLYDRLQWLSLRYYDRHPTGANHSRLTQDTNGVQDFLAFGLPFLVGNICRSRGGHRDDVHELASGPDRAGSDTADQLARAGPVDAHAAGLSRLVVPVGSLLRLSQRRLESRAHHQGFLSAGQGDRSLLEPQRRGDEGRHHADQLWAAIFPVVSLLLALGTYAVWYFGGWQVVKDPQVTPGTLIGLLSYLGFLWGPVNFMTQLVQWMTRALTASERIFEVLDAESDREGGQGEIVPETIRGEIEFRNVTFGYKADQPVLKEVSFKAEPGKMLGLVGKSGAGKSTVINLICRFYEVDQGDILVDGVKLKDLSLWAYRGKLGAVLQEPFLFSGTVSDNIAYGKPEATREEIMAAAKIANAHEFIVNRSDGYDSQVGERGGNLSGGEKQRLCIARRDSPRPGHSDPRRGHGERGPGDGGADSGGPRAADGGPHDDRHRAPPLHPAECRPSAGDSGRQGGRVRDAPGTRGE